MFSRVNRLWVNKKQTFLPSDGKKAARSVRAGSQQDDSVKSKCIPFRMQVLYACFCKKSNLDFYPTSLLLGMEGFFKDQTKMLASRFPLPSLLLYA